MFTQQLCDGCSKDNAAEELYCPILTSALMFKLEDPQYPQEWIYGPGGQPTCTAYDGP